jgi:alpha-1,6-mannosyltransferase
MGCTLAVLESFLKSFNRYGLWGTGCLLEAGFLFLACLHEPAKHIVLFLGIYAGLLGVMLASFYHVLTQPDLTSARERQLIWIFAILFRCTLLGTWPHCSDDIFRYTWEGRVQRAGYSPYDYPPAAPELVSLRDASYPYINHKGIPTIYPPLTQLTFRLGTYLGDGLRQVMSSLRAGILSQKLIFVAFDLLVLALLSQILRERSLSEKRLLLYAWNPLVVLEFAGSGHNDALGIFYLLAGLWAWQNRQYVWGGLGLAASFLCKYVSILLVPWLLWQERWKALAVYVGFIVMGFLPFCACWMMAHGAQHYLANWQFNGSLFTISQAVLGQATRAKIFVACLLGGISGWVGIKEQDMMRGMAVLIAAALLLAPTVHPWYFIWLIPFLCLFPHPAFILWNGSLALSYTVLCRYARYQTWDLHPAIQALEYIPVYGTLLYSLWVKKRGIEK